MKGVVSAKKALYGSKRWTRELLGGTEEKSMSLVRALICPTGKCMFVFFAKRKLKEI